LEGGNRDKAPIEGGTCDRKIFIGKNYGKKCLRNF
jgi:hypothetical protein